MAHGAGIARADGFIWAYDSAQLLLAHIAGILEMANIEGGDVRPGDAIRVELPDMPHLPLKASAASGS